MHSCHRQSGDVADDFAGPNSVQGQLDMAVPALQIIQHCLTHGPGVGGDLHSKCTSLLLRTGMGLVAQRPNQIPSQQGLATEKRQFHGGRWGRKQQFNADSPTGWLISRASVLPMAQYTQRSSHCHVGSNTTRAVEVYK